MMMMMMEDGLMFDERDGNLFSRCLESPKAIQGEIKISTENGETRTLRSAPDWGEASINGDHLWVSTSASGDLCYVGENECSKQGPRLCCPACKITAHTGCIGILIDKIKFHCKSTFKDVGVRQYREQTVIHHHWVHRRHQKGRCRQCAKSFQSKLSFGNKEIVAIGCSWCKTAYHNKETCFTIERITETCPLGMHSDLIIPPTWIVKLPRKGSFKSSIRRSPKTKRASSKRRAKAGGKDESGGGNTAGVGGIPINSNMEYGHNLPLHPSIHGLQSSPGSSPPMEVTQPMVHSHHVPGGHRSFTIKPIPSPSSRPLLVFINPKSGGNQGSKLMQKFQWLLNPRQVFDMNQGGPKFALDLYKKVPNLRILACGGDGTAGWLMSVLDEMAFHPNPPIAVLPLGTGNDLARALGWGGGYTDEPVSKILLNVQDGEVVQLDRWDLRVEPNEDAPQETIDGSESGAKETLPYNVVNNYFSIGVDAHIALEFHEAREAHPERFNSRLRNKMFYGQAGGKDLLQRKWKDLCNYITLECDGVDITHRLKDIKVHSLLFLNIPSYGGGTRPWGTNSPSFETPRTDDGLIEVIGLTTYQLPLLQAGGHGSCIAQCKEARIITNRIIPMQVDGEPCKLLPSIINLVFRNQANMIAKAKSHTTIAHRPLQREVTLDVRKLNLNDYENYHLDKDKLKEVSFLMGKLAINPDIELDHARLKINELVRGLVNEKMHEINENEQKLYRIGTPFDLSSDWCFIDSCTAERFFRIDRAQENLHYVVDICNEDLFILDANEENNRDDPVVVNLLADPNNPEAGMIAKNLNESNNNTIVLFEPINYNNPTENMCVQQQQQQQQSKMSFVGNNDTNKKEESKSSSPPYSQGNQNNSNFSNNNNNNLNAPRDSGRGDEDEDGGEEEEEDEEKDRKPLDEVIDEGFSSSPKDVSVEKISMEVIEASRMGDLDWIKRLHKEGYSLYVIDEKGRTALHYSSRAGYEEIVEYLVQEAPLLLDMTESEEGHTALHKAARHRRKNICCILAVAGCSLSKLDDHGLTARELALKSNEPELAACLEHFERFRNTMRDKETVV